MQGELSGIEFTRQGSSAVEPLEPQAVRAQELLRGYFGDPLFYIPLLHPFRGTPFQRRVWQALQQIPPGEVRRYGDLAKQLASSPRAVAAACRANPLLILIPCHRVVSAKGLGGYMGKTEGPAVAIKQWLLHHEGYDSPNS